MPRGASTARGSVKFGALRWLFARSDLLWQELSPAVVEQATTLRAQHGLRTPDALQAACLPGVNYVGGRVASPTLLPV